MNSVSSPLLGSNGSATIQRDISIFSDPILLRAFLPFPLVRGYLLRYKPGLLPGSALYLFLCFGSWPSLWLLHFPHPARQSLSCLWNGSSAGLLWDVTEKGRPVAPHLCVPVGSPSGSVNSGLALLVFRLFVCAFVWEGERSLRLCVEGGPFCFFAFEVDVRLS